jgi:hypothetical protein
MTPRPHPLGIKSSPDWDGVWSRYIDLSEGVEPEEDAPLESDDREPSRFHVGLAILGCIIVALALFSAVLA